MGRRVYDRGKTAWAAAVGALVLAVLVLGSTAPSPAEPVEPSLWSRLQRIEAAFRAGDSGALRALLPAEAKVRVDLPGFTDGPRSYGPGQLEVIFQQVFAASTDRELTFRADDVKAPGAGTAFARGRWTRKAASGAVATDFLTLTLRENGGDWRIHEILGSR